MCVFEAKVNIFFPFPNDYSYLVAYWPFLIDFAFSGWKSITQKSEHKLYFSQTILATGLE